MYKGAWDQGDWKKLALQVPEALADDLDEDLTILDGYSWFYPLASEEDGDATLKRLWFGKSWDDIGKSYGTHVWHWSEDFRHLVTPEVVRTIDTPLFCSLRHLFDDLDRDGYNSTELEENANCSITTVEKLKEKNHRIFADYRMDSDDVDTKWVDSSGYNLHGWAPEVSVFSLQKSPFHCSYGFRRHVSRARSSWWSYSCSADKQTHPKMVQEP